MPELCLMLQKSIQEFWHYQRVEELTELILRVTVILAYPENIQTASSSRKQAVDMKIPTTRIFMESNSKKFQPLFPLNHRHWRRSRLSSPTIRSSISHVFDKFKDFLFTAAHFSRLLTSASFVSEFLQTGTLIVILSAYFEIPLSESKGFVSSTIKENYTLRHSSINIDLVSNISIPDDPLLTITKETDNPIDDIWIEINRPQVFADNFMRDGVESFTKVK